MEIQNILKLIDIGLMILGGLSGAVLFLRAAVGKAEEGGSTGTRWELFLLGLIIGVGLLFYSNV